MADSFELLSEEHTKDLEKALKLLKVRIAELLPEEKIEFDDRTIKPIQTVLAAHPSDEHLRAAELGLGEVLKQEFDLDWVTAMSKGQAIIGLNIPCTDNLIFPQDFFYKTLKEGHGANARVTYLKWAEYIGEHAFD